MSNTSGADTAPPSRRSVVKGAAWAVPAIIVAGAAPTVAASTVCLTASFGATSCKQPGNTNNYGYRLDIRFTNSCPTSVTITVTQVASNTGNAVVQPVNQTITVPGGATVGLPQPVLYCGKSSANFINVSYTTQGKTGTQVASVPSPVQQCAANDLFCK